MASSRRATNCSLSSTTEHSFQGITPSLKGGKVYVSGTICYLVSGPSQKITRRRFPLVLRYRDSQ
jgi:hypothetical protein